MNRPLKQGRMPAFVSHLIILFAIVGCGSDDKSGGAADHCSTGSVGCACRPDESCDGKLVCGKKGICIAAADETEPPKDPVCYTPCNHGYTDATGKYFECSADGLMKRCIDGMKCVNGSCLPDATPGALGSGGVAAAAGASAVGQGVAGQATAAPGSCARDAECPDYQVCIQGKCYSDCEYDSDCGSGKKCYRKSCRTPCSASASPSDCSDGSYCSVVDSENGFCMPLQQPAKDVSARTRVAGTFELASDTLAFSSSHITDRVKLLNRSDLPIEFTISKIDHTEYQPTGVSRVTTNPMPWMAIGEVGNVANVNSFKVLVQPNSEAAFAIENAATGMPAKWDGSLEVSSAELGSRKIALSYSQGTDGRWAGVMYYFAQFGDLNLDTWLSARDDDTTLAKVGNALLQRWGALRKGRISMDEFQAVVRATSQGTWTWPSVKSVCPTAACYLYSNTEGFGRYSDSLENQPVPSGVSELPLTLDLQASDATHLDGRILSHESLHYSADPAVHLEFSDDPSQCSAVNSTACIAFIKSLGAKIVVGGRYHTTSADKKCVRTAAGYQLVQTPWLVPGFLANTETDDQGNRYTYECRDTVQPFGDVDPEKLPVNLSLAQANPIPDGRSRRRRLELVDGALVNQDTMYLILRERFEESFLGNSDTTGFSAYSLAVLKRSNAQIASSEFRGIEQTEQRASTVTLGDSVHCSEALLEKALGAKTSLTAANVERVAATVLDGIAPDDNSATVDPQAVHYLCENTGLFDQGALTNATAAECPAGSKVTYFTFKDSQKAPADFAALPCQKGGKCKNDLPSHDLRGSFDGDSSEYAATADCEKPGTCEQVLQSWVNDGLVQTDLISRCAYPNQISCDSTRTDLKAGKTFQQYVPGAAVFNPLVTSVDDAFRYKTQFRDRDGKSVGFAPSICVERSDAVPYCYDPAEIEQIRDRVDCLTSIYTASSTSNRKLTLTPELRERLKQYLIVNYSYRQETVSDLAVPVVYDGFEKLNSELLIMLGDDAYTKSFQSRFDLASSAIVSFEGSKLEPNGIDLAGVAGYEMYTLYQATQYYQSVLDRFYELSPYLWSALSEGGAENFVTQETVVSYFDKLMRASTQKSRAWSEIAKRYQSFNRPDLARFVSERAYTATYLESIVLSRMLQNVVQIAKAEKRDQIRKSMESAALSYRAALLDMRNVYAQFTDETTNFGFSQDYIPMPALPTSGANAFDVLLALAKQAAAAAKLKEEVAIGSSREFNSSAQAFQSELTQIQNTFENQLAEICGTFVGKDGQVYPAIAKYAYLNERAAVFGDPCGLMGTGSLNDAILSLDSIKLDVQGISNAYDKLLDLVDIEFHRLQSQCAEIDALARYQWQQQGKIDDLQSEIGQTQLLVGALGRRLEMVKTVASLSKCTVGMATDCPSAMVSLGTYLAASVGSIAVQDFGEAEVEGKREQIAEIQRSEARWTTEQQCDIAKIDSDAKVKEYLLGLKDIDLDALKAQYRIQLALSDIEKLRNQAARIQSEEQEAQQLAINAQSAKTDPNIRIYRNDAIINADRTFQSALQATYQASKVFEYYSSQSYAKLQDLALVRLVSHGDYNLEGYLSELEDAYNSFQETFGKPDTRVQVLSLRDDILSIPRYGEDRSVLTQTDRVARFRKALADTRWLDANGYLVIPFGTSLDKLSPLTRNHKVLYVEAEIIGSDIGDSLGRVYLKQNGTGVILSVGNDKDYYRFPERTAVINPFFNGVRTFAPEVYRSDRLRDRPLVNTHWEFVLNQRDEYANQDINLNALTDIRLLVYYTDFTNI